MSLARFSTSRRILWAGGHAPPCPICRSCSPFAGPSRPLSSSTPALRRERFASEPESRPTSRFIPVRNRAQPVLTPRQFAPRPRPTPGKIAKIIAERAPEWAAAKRTKDQLAVYGLPSGKAVELLREWKELVLSRLESLSDEAAEQALGKEGWDVARLEDAVSKGDFGIPMEGAFLRHFLSWTLASPRLSPSVAERIKSILGATNLTRLPFQGGNLIARSVTRHFHLHIGPTNSGKTYNALKALSKAPTGAYAGPLRLLAHEVWERLNLGTVGDLNGRGRPCNLLTGEERRVVAEDAGLSSCTVEMLPLNGPGGNGYDVVVIDEIQMLGDAQRGGAWTNAVLGVKSKEVHLCGDETTVELLRPLIASLGDEMTIHRYERLTPLAVGDESLGGDFLKAEAGDCFVTFSRTNIFTVKRMIEQTAGKKCAVVYGTLPPETRAEQAKDFNEGRAEVLVASDAVGMGLNLKIKRMIFESLHKFNGKEDVPLALTQIKQIAGRAGRFGMHKADSGDVTSAPPAPLGGIVTTLHDADLPVLRSLLPMPLPSIPRAVLDVPFDTLAALHALLPPSTTYAELLSHVAHLVALPPHTALVSIDHKTPLADLIEPFRDYLDLAECELFAFSPVNHRDPRMVSIFVEVLRGYAQDGVVHLQSTFEESRLFNTLELVEGTLSVLPPVPPLAMGRKPLVPPILITSIPLLETLHKALVLYIWLSFRLSLAFPDRQSAVELKERTEKALEECLKRLPGLRNKKHYEIERDKLKEYKGWKREVAPNGTRKDAAKDLKGRERKGVNWADLAEMRQRAAEARGMQRASEQVSCSSPSHTAL